MTFEDIVVDETSLSRKDKFCVTSLYEGHRGVALRGTGSRIVAGGQGMGRHCSVRVEFGEMKRSGDVAQQRESTQCHWTRHVKMLKMVHLMLRVFYYN